FSGLIADFPDSENKETYEFQFEFSDLRSRVFKQGTVPAANIAAFAPWVKNQAKNPLFAKYKDDVAETYVQLLDDRFELAERALNPQDPDNIDGELEEARPYIPPLRAKALGN